MPRSKLQAKNDVASKSGKKSGKMSAKSDNVRTHKFRPGTKALMEIKRFQKSKELLI